MADTVNYNEIRRGLNVELDGDAYQIVDFKHVYMQQRAPTLTLKVRQLRSGKVFERNLPGSQRLTVAEVEQTEAQYLYNDGDSYVFMDTETFDQFPLTPDQIGDQSRFLKEGESITIVAFKGEPVSIELATTVDLEVIDTPPAFKGDTASSGRKPATLATGAQVKVPMHVDRWAGRQGGHAHGRVPVAGELAPGGPRGFAKGHEARLPEGRREVWRPSRYPGVRVMAVYTVSQVTRYIKESLGTGRPARRPVGERRGVQRRPVSGRPHLLLAQGGQHRSCAASCSATAAGPSTLQTGPPSRPTGAFPSTRLGATCSASSTWRAPRAWASATWSWSGSSSGSRTRASSSRAASARCLSSRSASA